MKIKRLRMKVNGLPNFKRSRVVKEVLVMVTVGAAILLLRKKNTWKIIDANVMC